MRKAMILLFLPILIGGTDLGRMGEVYPVIEIDFDEFLQIKANSFDFEAYINANNEKFERSIIEVNTAKTPLPSANKDNIRHVKLEHILESEIFTFNNGVKQVIYPEGFKYNVLDYVKLDYTYITINANNEKEITWVIDKGNTLEPYMLLISEGESLKLAEKLKRPVYILNELVKKGLHIEATPSVVYQEDNFLVIKEYELKEVK